MMIQSSVLTQNCVFKKKLIQFFAVINNNIFLVLNKVLTNFGNGCDFKNVYAVS